VKLERVHNFRDVGGVTTSTGRRVRRGRLYRSSELTHASAADVAALTAAGVATIVDLRTDGERRT